MTKKPLDKKNNTKNTKHDELSKTDSHKEAFQELKDHALSLKDQNIRLMAEMENLRKQQSEQLLEARKYAPMKIGLDWVNGIDQLEMAIVALEKQGADKNIVDGLHYTHKGMLQALTNHGIFPMDVEDKQFDPELHEAMSTVDADEANLKPNHISSIMQNGYSIHDRILRPAKVIVAISKKNDKKT